MEGVEGGEGEEERGREEVGGVGRCLRLRPDTPWSLFSPCGVSGLGVSLVPPWTLLPFEGCFGRCPCC